MSSLIPSGFRGFSGDLRTFGFRHSLETALTADVTAFASDWRLDEIAIVQPYNKAVTAEESQVWKLAVLSVQDPYKSVQDRYN